MKIKKVLFIAIISIITLSHSCSKDELILNEEYLTVSDVIRYCSNCGKSYFFSAKLNKMIAKCDNKEVKLGIAN